MKSQVWKKKRMQKSVCYMQAVQMVGKSTIAPHPLQQVRMFSKPSYPSSDLDSPCNLKSSSASSWLLPLACSNDRVRLYGLSGAAWHRYPTTGVPEHLPADPLTESWEQLHLEVVLNAPPLWLLLPLHWLCGLKSGWRWSSTMNSTARDIGLLKPGASPGAPSGFRWESRYLRA